MDEPLQSVTVAHASFWYTKGDRNAIAVRGDVIKVGPKDLDRGVKHGAFLVAEPDVAVVDVVDELEPEGVDDAVEVEAVEPPAKSASKAEWEAYARSQGATDEDLEGQTKDELVTLYGG